MNVLVTGGCGFIGSNLVKYLRKHRPAWKVVNLDKLTYAGNLENLKDLEADPGHIFVRGDIGNRELVDHLIRQHKIDGIMHLAAESHVDRSILGPEAFIVANVLGTNVLLESARHAKIGRFLMVSTDEVYGSLGPTGAFTEKLIPLMVANALQDKPLPVYGQGTNVRDWLQVEDHCSALTLALEKGKKGAVYNIGGNSERQNIQIVKAILELLGKPASLIKYVTDRPGHDARYAIDATKIRADLGWTPSHTFEKGLADTVKWYVDNRPWWERVMSGAYRQYFDSQYAARLKS